MNSTKKISSPSSANPRKMKLSLKPVLNVKILKRILSNSDQRHPVKSTSLFISKHKVWENSSKTVKKRKNEANLNHLNKKIHQSFKTSEGNMEENVRHSKMTSEETEEDVTKQANKQQHFLSVTQQRLEAAKFRLVNEQLYTTTGSQAMQFFHEEDPQVFSVYHRGYQQQVSKWPLNPLDAIIQSIQKTPLKRSKVIADLGCGEAKLAQTLASTKRTIHSFDLRALNENVVECDMAQLPLENETVDIVVFCLSLMGTNIRDYLLSASRVLKKGGVMKIAEVQSRFDSVKDFTTSLKKFGFKLLNQDDSNNFFILMDFLKKRDALKKSQISEITLNPCVYKKR